MTYINDALSVIREVYRNGSEEELLEAVAEKLRQSWKNGLDAGRARAGSRGKGARRRQPAG